MPTILIIDDNETIRLGLEHVVKRMGYEAVIASGGAQGIERFGTCEPDFVITDLKMDGVDGVEVLKHVAAKDPDCPTMIITAFGTVETAVEAMKLGAFDFLQKPFSPEVVRLKVERALQIRAERTTRQALEAENAYLRQEVDGQFGEIVGEAPPMRTLFRMIQKVAATDSAVFISGESGTGKELVARAIHNLSRRKDGPFVKVNCGALTETLLESELFGHERGAFTGAVRRHIGRFEIADAGTLFLDEIGDVSPGLQVKLLRVLQEQTFERVGGEKTVSIDVRVLSATNKNLNDEVAEGRFREDLYYRLHIVPLKLPSLRERRDDIPLLARHFVRKLGPRTNARVKAIGDDALGRLLAYGWPGNVRELENVIEQSLVFADGDTIDVTALPEHLKGDDERDGESAPAREGATLPQILEDLERELIVKAFREAKGVKTETARRLGIKTSALYYKLDKYGVG